MPKADPDVIMEAYRAERRKSDFSLRAFVERYFETPKVPANVYQSDRNRDVCAHIDTLWPEPTLAAGGAWWHPVGITDPAMQVASTPLPVVTVFAVIRATLHDRSRDRTSALEAFRCT